MASSSSLSASKKKTNSDEELTITQLRKDGWRVALPYTNRKTVDFCSLSLHTERRGRGEQAGAGRADGAGARGLRAVVEAELVTRWW